MATEHPAQVHIRTQLRWSDIDSLGHLRHSAYHDLLVEARIAVLSGRASDFVLARVELDHRREILLSHERVDVLANVSRVGRSSLTIEHRILLPDGTVAADGRSVMVGWDGEARASRELDADERAAFGAPIPAEAVAR